MKKVFFGFIIIGFVILQSCNSTETKSVSTTTAPSLADTISIKTIVKNWNESINKKDIASLSLVYTDVVSAYGKSLSKEDVLKSKELYLDKYPGFSQDIVGDIKITKDTGDLYKAEFQKKFVIKDLTKVSYVQAYLILKDTLNTWKICVESDNVTDGNILKANSGQKKSNKGCVDVVYEIVLTCPEFVKRTKGLEEAVQKNGGSGYGTILYSSPNPEQDESNGYSEDYEFGLHESYPDRIVNVAYFSFNPASQKLYMPDIDGENKEIEFNRELLKKLSSSCK